MKQIDVVQRLSVVETEIKAVKKDVNRMMTNELPHIAKEVRKINTNFKVYKAKTAVWTGIFIFIATVLSQIAVKIFVG